MAIQLGAEPKKVAILGGLLAVAAVALYLNVFSEPEPDAGPSLAPRPAASGAIAPAPAGGPGPGAASSASRNLARNRAEFRPSLKRRPEDAIDLAKVDPALRLDLLDKVRAVTALGQGRNIFEFSAAPPPPPPPNTPAKPEPKIIPKMMEPVAAEAAPPAPAEPVKPQAPPIPLKFYGYSSPPRGGMRRAFFLDGEEIVVATEGEMIKKRYKVIRIGQSNVEMEDTQFSQRQTLRLEEQPGAGG